MDLKQYAWEPDSETLTPFLTLEMIAKWRLDHSFTLKKQDKTCQTMAPPPKPPEGGGTAGPSKKMIVRLRISISADYLLPHEGVFWWGGSHEGAHTVTITGANPSVLWYGASQAALMNGASQALLM